MATKTSTPDPVVEEGPRSFCRTLERVGEGSCESELSQELFDVLKALAEEAVSTNSIAKGTLTLKLSFQVDPEEVVKTAYDVSTKLPTRRRRGSIFWLTKGGNLSPENPRQQSLPLHAVPAAPVRDLPSESTPSVRQI